MIYNLKRFIIPILLLTANILLSLMIVQPSITAKVLYSNLILSLFSLLASNYKDHFGLINKKRQTYLVIGFLYALGIISVIIFIHFVPVSLSGDILKSSPYVLVFLLLLVNILFSLSFIDWESEESLKKTWIFILKVTVFIIFLSFLKIVVYLSFSKETGLLSEHQIFNFPVYLGIAPVIVLLMVPNYPKKTPSSFNSSLLVVPLAIVAIFFVSSLLEPNPSENPDVDTEIYSTDQYLSYLEEKKLLKDEKLQANLDLTYQERKEFVAISQEIAPYELPEYLDVIKFLADPHWTNYQEKLKLFTQVFGFSPVTYLSPIESITAEHPELPETTQQTDEQVNALLKEKSVEMLENPFVFRDFYDRDYLENIYDFQDTSYKLKAEIKTQPEQYVLTLQNSQGETLVTMDLFDAISRHQAITKYPDDESKTFEQSEKEKREFLESLILHFEDDGRLGYLMITEINYIPINKRTDFKALVVLEKEKVTYPKPVSLSFDWPGRRINIDENYQAILPFNFDLRRTVTHQTPTGKLYHYDWLGFFALDEHLYNAYIEQPTDIGGLRITVTDTKETEFSVLLNEDEVSAHLEEDETGKLTAKRYQDENFVVDVLLYPIDDSRYEGILFINKQKTE